jgi:RNA polymerase sigma-70 factor (ECF subfamily)
MFIDQPNSFFQKTGKPVELKKLPAGILQAAIALQQGRAGEEQWRVIWNYYRPKLDAVAQKFHLQCCDREDVVQKIFMRVFKHGEKLAQPEKFEFWLMRIAYNEMKRFVSQPRRMVCKQELFWQKGGEESPSERLAADLPPQAQKLERRVKSRVDQMPSRMREAYLLCKVQRLRQKEAAQRMQISVKGVQRHLDLARNFLRQSLAAGQKNS